MATPAAGAPATAAAPAGAKSSTREAPDRASRVTPPAVNQAAEFLLGALLWAWVGLPFLKGGPGQVRDTLRAKFFNKGPDGKWLP